MRFLRARQFRFMRKAIYAEELLGGEGLRSLKSEVCQKVEVSLRVGCWLLGSVDPGVPPEKFAVRSVP